MATRLRWLGHSSLLLESDGQRILIDPFLTGNPAAEPLMAFEQLTDLPPHPVERVERRDRGLRHERDLFPTLAPKTATVPPLNPLSSTFVNVPEDVQRPATDFWSLSLQRQFGANPQIIGQKMDVDAVPFTVIGVMPRGFSFPKAHSGRRLQRARR